MVSLGQLPDHLVVGGYSTIYHKKFQPEIVAKFFTRRVDMIFDGELFPSAKFNFVDVYLEFLVYHLNSITSDQGKNVLSKLDFKRS